MTYNFIDKSDWMSGEWDNEPDKIQFVDSATGLPCLIVRNHMGALCGYVGVSWGHPSFKKNYEKVEVDVHGGLTFSGSCQNHEYGICHKVEEGENDNIWWLGFDCSHFGDIVPSLSRSRIREITKDIFTEGHYRNIAYVKEQIASLAKQLKAQKGFWGNAIQYFKKGGFWRKKKVIK